MHRLRWFYPLHALLIPLILLGLACAGIARPPATRVILTPPASPQPPLATPWSPASTSVVESLPAPTLPAGFYRAQSGDTLAGLAGRWHVVTDTLLTRNPGLPLTQTIAPGVLLGVPADPWPPSGYAVPIVPDSAVVYAPDADQFDLRGFVLAQPGYLSAYTETLEADPPDALPRTGWQIVALYARSYSIHPRLLLTLLEYQSRALSDPAPAEFARNYPLGAYSAQMKPGLSHQLGWVGNQLNYGYYGWRSSELQMFFTIGSGPLPASPALNAGSFAVLRVLGQLYAKPDFKPEEFQATYQRLFGDPFAQAVDLLPGRLTQPPFQLPFEPGVVWSFTSGPHPGYGSTLPFGALDFAPAMAQSGCATSTAWITAVHTGTVAYSGEGRVELDLGDGWTVVYLHVATFERIPAGAKVNAGDQLGHPSCEGGTSTGTHLHLSRKYHGEWIPADGFAPFALEGWVAHFGPRPYQGTLTRGDQTLVACPCADAATLIEH